jgi:hypothetical protein
MTTQQTIKTLTFKQLNEKMLKQFESMQKFKLFRLNISGIKIWDAYIDGFTAEQDPIFRDPNSSTHTCNDDKNFIRRYGNVVAINDANQIVTMFDIDVTDTNYENSIANIQSLLQSGAISDVFFETFNELNSLPYESIKKNQARFKLGKEKTLKKYTQAEVDAFGVVNTNDIYEFNHFHAFLDKSFVDQSGKSIESIMGEYRDAKNVFQRGMQEIPLDTLSLVKDLIVQGSLLNADAHLFKLDAMIPLKERYDALAESEKDNWCWLNSYDLPFAKFRNELIGTLCVELAEGKELNEACLTWNKRVDPANYMKAKSPITQRQIDEAETFLSEYGYVESFDRRFTVLSDIDVSEIQHMNVSTKEAKNVGLFKDVKPSASTRHKRSQFDNVETVPIEKFMKDVLPSCTSIEAYFENRMQDNLTVMTTANVKESKPIFKWSNNMSWTNRGNLAGKSMIKEAVKEAGGNVDGIMNCRLAWNIDKEGDYSDLDLWCIQPNTQRIGFNSGFRKDSGNRFSVYGGQLDVDDLGRINQIHVENIYFIDESKLKNGQYTYWVNQFAAKNSQGFKAEIEINGTIYSYEYNSPVRADVKIATVTYKDGQFNIEHHLPETNSSKNVWGIDTEHFHKVNLVCLSPNHWGENNVGNKHYFFMLDGCKSDVPMRSFHNENLNGELLKFRKVMEVLADTRKLEPTDNQLAGLAFNSTVRDEVILKLSGSHKRAIKVIF